jgi:uncharacterized membrane protein
MTTDPRPDDLEPAPPPAPPAFNLTHLVPTFGNNWFALKAEAFARIFGTPVFLVTQTLIVLLWIGVNSLKLTKFDQYPFILLNLAFSLQAAYAAPLILLAQTRQAERDKVYAEADAKHREGLALASAKRERRAERQNIELLQLLRQNTELTQMVKDLSQRMEVLVREVHGTVVPPTKQ